MQLPPEQRDLLWQQAVKIVNDFTKQDPQNPRLVRVRRQRGLVHLAWGERPRQELEVARIATPA